MEAFFLLWTTALSSVDVHKRYPTSFRQQSQISSEPQHFTPYIYFYQQRYAGRPGPCSESNMVDHKWANRHQVVKLEAAAHVNYNHSYYHLSYIPAFVLIANEQRLRIW